MSSYKWQVLMSLKFLQIKSDYKKQVLTSYKLLGAIG